MIVDRVTILFRHSFFEVDFSSLTGRSDSHGTERDIFTNNRAVTISETARSYSNYRNNRTDLSIWSRERFY